MMMFTAPTAWAEQVTEEEARQQAQHFLTSLQPTGKARRAPGTTPQFAATRQLSGLWLRLQHDNLDVFAKTGLTPDTDYYVQVRGDYGSDGKGEWATSLFTTPADHTTAISLAAPDSSPKGGESIYTLEGVKLDKVSIRKGVYIQNRRVVVVK